MMLHNEEQENYYKTPHMKNFQRSAWHKNLSKSSSHEKLRIREWKICNGLAELEKFVLCSRNNFVRCFFQ